jgi:hypothetical protein
MSKSPKEIIDGEIYSKIKGIKGSTSKGTGSPTAPDAGCRGF